MRELECGNSNVRIYIEIYHEYWKQTNCMNQLYCWMINQWSWITNHVLNLVIHSCLNDKGCHLEWISCTEPPLESRKGQKFPRHPLVNENDQPDCVVSFGENCTEKKIRHRVHQYTIYRQNHPDFNGAPKFAQQKKIDDLNKWLGYSKSGHRFSPSYNLSPWLCHSGPPTHAWAIVDSLHSLKVCH